VLGPEDLLPDGEGALEQRPRGRVVAPGPEEAGQVVEARGHRGIFGSERLLDRRDPSLGVLESRTGQLRGRERGRASGLQLELEPTSPPVKRAGFDEVGLPGDEVRDDPGMTPDGAIVVPGDDALLPIPQDEVGIEQIGTQIEVVGTGLRRLDPERPPDDRRRRMDGVQRLRVHHCISVGDRAFDHLARRQPGRVLSCRQGCEGEDQGRREHSRFHGEGDFPGSSASPSRAGPLSRATAGAGQPRSRSPSSSSAQRTAGRRKTKRW
jgi:hypothetical protein